MSRLTDQEKNFLHYIFIDLHGKRGESGFAARLVAQEFRAVQKENNPEYWAELAQQLVVLNHEAALLERSFLQAAPYLLDASNFALSYFPVAITRTEATLKALPWEHVCGPTPAGTFETFRSMVSLLDTLNRYASSISVNTQPTENIQSNLLGKMLTTVEIENPPLRGALLANLEYSPYQMVRDAGLLADFRSKFPDPQSQVSALSAWLGRAVRSGDWTESGRTIGEIYKVLRLHPSLFPQGVRDILKATQCKDLRIAGWRDQFYLGRTEHVAAFPAGKIISQWFRSGKFVSPDGTTSWDLR